MDGRFSPDMTGSMALLPAMLPDAGLAPPPADFTLSNDWRGTSKRGLFQAVPLAAMAQASQHNTQKSPVVPPDAPPDAIPHEAMPHDSTAPVPQQALEQPARDALHRINDTAPPHPADMATPTMRADLQTKVLADLRADLRTELRTELMAELETERAAMAATARSLAAALEQISNPPAAQLSDLALQLGQAVARLASDRAGQAIDTDAAPFARRITQLAQRVSDRLHDVTLGLHPADRAAVASLLQQACPPDLADLAQARLQPDPDLMRGDVRLRLSDARASVLRLDDLIAPHIPPKPKGPHHD